MSRTEKKETVKSRLHTTDLIPRIVCVFFAIIVWLYVMATESPNYERTFSGVSVLIENAAILSNSNDLSVISGYDKYTDITVTGKKRDLISLSVDDIKASVDVSTITEAGKKHIGISVHLPDGCTLTGISPSAVEIYADQIATKTVPVKVNIVSVQYDSEYSLGVPITDVSEITVSGPTSVIDAASAAVVDLELGSVSTSATARGALRVVGGDGATIDNPYLTMSQSSVGVELPVYVERTINLTAGTKYGYINQSNSAISVTPSKITVKADPKLLDGIDSIQIAVIDEKKLTSGGQQMVSIVLPDGIENVSGASTAQIKVTHKNTVEKTLALTDITILNPNGLNYNLVTESINVALRADRSIADKITPEDIRLTAELNYSGITGTVQVPVTVSLAAEYAGSAYELGEYTATVMIEK